MAITASFSPNAGLLSEFGDQFDNTIVTSRNAAGQILVNGGAVSIDGGQPTVANTGEIQVSGQRGNDTISLDESNGALPAAQLSGGVGNDMLIGGSGADQLSGDAGNDTLLGKGGADILAGGNGDDVLTGGDDDDQMFGEAGNDRLIWNPGDDTDLFEGGEGTDTAEVNGGNGAERFSITANGGRVRFDRLDPAPFTLDIGTTENLVLNANGGDDVIDASALPGGEIALTVNGGLGNDTIIGSAGDDLIVGGDGDDSALMGAGDDTFIWNPGDDNDTLEGQAGTDTLLFNGANINEKIDISANGERARFFRDIANVTMDLNDTETIDFHALGGADTITVNDLSGTDVKKVNIDLAGSAAGGGDGQVDTIIINATNGDDAIEITKDRNGVVTVSGLATELTISNFEANDRIVINGQLLGQFMASSFVTPGEGHSATPITDQPSSQPPVLTQPHT